MTLERRQIRLAEPIKTIGIHRVTVALHPEVEVELLVNVARSEEEAAIQAGEKGPEEEEGGEETPAAAAGEPPAETETAGEPA